MFPMNIYSEIQSKIKQLSSIGMCLSVHLRFPLLLIDLIYLFIYLFSQFNCPRNTRGAWRLDSIQHGPKGAPLLLGQLGSIAPTPALGLDPSSSLLCSQEEFSG
jgi:hypothetical protein